MSRKLICPLLIILSMHACNEAPIEENNKLSVHDTIPKTTNMNNENYSTSFVTDKDPQTVFNAVNNVRGWWSQQIDGSTDSLHAVFSYHYKDVHRAKMKIIEFVPGKKVVWLVTENEFNFTKDKNEWTNTRISFDISKKGNQTELLFTHIGLTPAYECYIICKDSWGNYIGGSLKNLVETGSGNPNPYEASIKNAATLKKDNQQ